jgi:hypothetical protein
MRGTPLHRHPAGVARVHAARRPVPNPMKIGVACVAALLLSASSAAVPAQADASPVQTIERLHRAFYDADPATVDSVLHPEYHGLSLQGPPGHRHIYVESRAKAVSDVAHLKPGEWEVRLLRASTQVDPAGLAHVWIRYVFNYKGVPEHCGYESYGLFRGAGGWKVISFADTDNPLRRRPVDQVCPDSTATR